MTPEEIQQANEQDSALYDDAGYIPAGGQSNGQNR